MTRNIPQVRRWLVNYWRDGKVIHSVKVDTINKDFAKWMAHEQVGWGVLWNCDKRTVSLLRRGA